MNPSHLYVSAFMHLHTAYADARRVQTLEDDSDDGHAPTTAAAEDDSQLTVRLSVCVLSSSLTCGSGSTGFSSHGPADQLRGTLFAFSTSPARLRAQSLLLTLLS